LIIVIFWTHLSYRLHIARTTLAHHPQIGKSKQHLELEVILLDASVEDLPESKLAFDDPEWMLHLRSEMGFGALHQLEQLSFRCIR
jgi:hypothetical protein